MEVENTQNYYVNYREKIFLHLNKYGIVYGTIFFILLKCYIFLLWSDYFSSHLVYIFFSGMYVIFIASFSLLFKTSLRRWYLLFINFIISLLLVIDLLYYKSFSTVPSLYSIKQIKDLGLIINSAFTLIHLEYFFFLDILVFLILFVISKQYYEYSRKIKSFVAIIIICCFCISFAPLTSAQLDDKEYITMTYSPIAYHFADAYIFFFERKAENLTPEKISEINKWYAENKENLLDNKYKGIFKGKNIIFIQFESLENFVINQKINGKEITPTLNKLINKGLYFSNIYDQTKEGTSADASLLVNTSLYPIKNGNVFYKFADNTYNSLPKIFKKYGFTSLDIYPVHGDFWNWENAQKSFGYDRFIDDSSFNIYGKECIGLGISDKDLFEQSDDYIYEMKQPFLAFISNLSSHMPFELPRAYRELNLDQELNNSYLGGYLESIHYSDKQIGEFISKISEKGLIDNTVIVIYGDHGGVHAYYNKEIEKLHLAESNSWMIKNNNEIPLIIYSNNIECEEIKKNGGLVDVLPTICYLYGIEENEYINTAMGRNLLNTERDCTILADKTFIGTSQTEQEKQHVIQGIDMADIIIRGNYFKK